MKIINFAPLFRFTAAFDDIILVSTHTDGSDEGYFISNIFKDI